MTISTRMTGAERAGRRLGQLWRRFAQRNRRVVEWFIGKGVPAPLAKTGLWSVEFLTLGAGLYVVAWPALMVLVAGVAVWSVRNGDLEEAERFWQVKEDPDHRNSIFYHPASFNDDPDPRFEKDRERS